jgi:hypothetical protein
VVKEKWSPAALLRSGDQRDLASDVDRRVRGTAGGDRLAALPYSVFTATASHPTLNCLLNSVVSDHAFFGSIDLTDFYLGTHNPFPQFLKMYLAAYPPSVVVRLRLQPFLKLDRHGKSLSPYGLTKPCTVCKRLGNCLTCVLSNFSHPMTLSRLPLPTSFATKPVPSPSALLSMTSESNISIALILTS